MTTKITLPEHLREYLQGKFCDFEDKSVRFPDNCDLYHTLYDLLEKRPADCPIDRGNVEIFLPKRSCGKQPETYNYLGTRSQSILKQRIELMMLAELHDLIDEQKHRYGINYIDSVHGFMLRYGIESLTEDAFLKNYYRWRQQVRRKEKKHEYRRKNHTEQV